MRKKLIQMDSCAQTLANISGLVEHATKKVKTVTIEHQFKSHLQPFQIKWKIAVQ